MLLMIIFLIVFIMFLFFTYVYFSRETILSEAIAFYDNGDVEKALDSFRSYAMVKPMDLRAKKYLAQIHYEQGDYLPALKECISITVKKYATLKEKSDAYALMAEIYIAQEIYDKAVKTAVEGFKLEPKNPKIHYQLGRIYMITDKKEKAIKEFNMVLSSERSNIDARMNLAMLHEAKRDKVKASFQYKKILEMEPNNVKARFNLGHLYYEDGNLQEAIDELLKIEESNLKEERLDYYYIISSYYMRNKNYEEAKKWLEKAVFSLDKKDDKMLQMQYELGVIYEEEEKLSEAYELYQLIKNTVSRYKDVVARLKRLKKILFPEEHAKIIDTIDYNSLTINDMEDLFKRLIDRLGYKEYKVLQKNRNKILIVAVEKFKTALQGKYLIQILRHFDMIGDTEIEKFRDRMEAEGCIKGICVTTSTYTEGAIELASDSENIELMDKVSIFETIGV